MSIEEIVEYVKVVQQTQDKFNKRTFKGRYHFGRVGELLFMLALDRGIIENFPKYVDAPKVEERDRTAVQINAINGDVEFYRKANFKDDGVLWEKKNKRKEFVDVKSTLFVAMDSLDRFRDDGWYFVNGLTENLSMGYYMIRNNAGFRKLIDDHWAHFKHASLDGVIIPFTYLPSEPKAYGLDMYSHMDASKYLRLVQELKRALQDVEPNLIGIPIYDPKCPEPLKEKYQANVKHLEF